MYLCIYLPVCLLTALCTTDAHSMLFLRAYQALEDATRREQEATTARGHGPVGVGMKRKQWGSAGSPPSFLPSHSKLSALIDGVVRACIDILLLIFHIHASIHSHAVTPQ